MLKFTSKRTGWNYIPIHGLFHPLFGPISSPGWKFLHVIANVFQEELFQNWLSTSYLAPGTRYSTPTETQRFWRNHFRRRCFFFFCDWAWDESMRRPRPSGSSNIPDLFVLMVNFSRAFLRHSLYIKTVPSQVANCPCRMREQSQRTFIS